MLMTTEYAYIGRTTLPNHKTKERCRIISNPLTLASWAAA